MKYPEMSDDNKEARDEYGVPLEYVSERKGFSIALTDNGRVNHEHLSSGCCAGQHESCKGGVRRAAGSDAYTKYGPVFVCWCPCHFIDGLRQAKQQAPPLPDGPIRVMVLTEAEHARIARMLRGVANAMPSDAKAAPALASLLEKFKTEETKDPSVVVITPIEHNLAEPGEYWITDVGPGSELAYYEQKMLSMWHDSWECGWCKKVDDRYDIWTASSDSQKMATLYATTMLERHIGRYHPEHCAKALVDRAAEVQRATTPLPWEKAEVVLG